MTYSTRDGKTITDDENRLETTMIQVLTQAAATLYASRRLEPKYHLFHDESVMDECIKDATTLMKKIAGHMVERRSKG